MTIAFGGSQMRDFVVYGLMIVTLLLRPQGLLGARSRVRAAGVMSTYYAGLFADIGILVLGALSVYIILVTNQLSLGNAGFMAIGSYVASFLTVGATLGIYAGVDRGRAYRLPSSA